MKQFLTVGTVVLLYVGAITGCKSAPSSADHVEAGSSVSKDDTLAKVRQLLRQAAWQGTGQTDFHACGFDDRMFKYLINDLQQGYVRQKASYSGEYKLEQGDDGTIYVSFRRGKVDAMYKLVKTQDGKNALLGDINLIQDAPEPKEEPAPEEQTASTPASTAPENAVAEVPAPVPQPDQVSIVGTVIVDKAYFYQEPNTNTRRKAYLIKDQTVTLGERKGDFVYCTYDESNTKGWMLIAEIKR